MLANKIFAVAVLASAILSGPCFAEEIKVVNPIAAAINNTMGDIKNTQPCPPNVSRCLISGAAPIVVIKRVTITSEG